MDSLEAAAVARAPPFQQLVLSVSQSFRLLEAWDRADVKVAELKPIVKDVQNQAICFYRGVDMSIAVAEGGFSMASDAQFLCEELQRPGTTIETVAECVQDLIQLADTAQRAAQETQETFRSIRVVMHERATDLEHTAISQTEKGHLAGLAAKLAFRKHRHAAAVGIGITIATAIVFAPLLPLAKLLGDFLKDKHEVHGKQYIAEEKEHHSAAELATQLGKDLKCLEAAVDLLVSYWGGIVTHLRTLDDKHALLLETGTELKARQCAQRWADVKSAFLDYKNHIQLLQDHYPSHARPAIGDHSCWSPASRRFLAARSKSSALATRNP